MAQKKASKTVKKIIKRTEPKRHTAMPKTSPQARGNAGQQQQGRSQGSQPSQASGAKQITRDMIAKRAFEIYKSGKGGSEMENWLRAERELRGN